MEKEEKKFEKSKEKKKKEKEKGKEKEKQEEFEKFKQPDINIGLVGHIDHGKTTLLWRLSGKWADVHSEELKRGITIKLGYANVLIRQCPNCKGYTYKEKCEKCNVDTKILRHVSFVDAPGHKMLMASMLGGAAIIDAAILVIAANEPFPQPQTKEHYLALNAKKVKHIIIVQNKIDLVSKEQAYQQYLQIREFFKDKSIPVIPCSAIQNVNIDLIFEEILKLPKPERDINAKPIFFVVRSFDVNLPGSDVTKLKGGILGGTLKQGKLKVGDEIEIKPGLAITKEVQHRKVTEYKELIAKVISMRSENFDLEEALPYGNLGIQTSLDPGITKADRIAGCVAGLKGTLPKLTQKIKFTAQLFEKLVGMEKEEAIQDIKVNEALLLSINTTLTVGIVKSIKKEKDKMIIEADTTTPIVPLPSAIGIARNYGGQWRLIGYGELIV